MAQEENKYLGKDGLLSLISIIKSGFATLKHIHNLEDITDYTVDESLSQISKNPVQNKVIKAALDEKVSVARTVNGKPLDADINLTASDVGAANSSHSHDDKYYTEYEIEEKLSLKSDTSHTHDDKYDEKGSADIINDKLIEHADNTDIHFSSTERIKLNNIEEGAQVNSVTGVKGSSEYEYRIGNINITKDNIGLTNVENKSSETIRGEITKSNVTTALGYTPYTPTEVDTKFNTVDKQIDILSEKKIFKSTITLSKNSWTNKTCTVSVSNVTANNIVIVAPVPNSKDAYNETECYCSAQGTGELTFKVEEIPTVDLSVNVVIINE